MCAPLHHCRGSRVEGWGRNLCEELEGGREGFGEAERGIHVGSTMHAFACVVLSGFVVIMCRCVWWCWWWCW